MAASTDAGTKAPAVAKKPKRGIPLLPLFSTSADRRAEESPEQAETFIAWGKGFRPAIAFEGGGSA